MDFLGKPVFDFRPDFAAIKAEEEVRGSWASSMGGRFHSWPTEDAPRQTLELSFLCRNRAELAALEAFFEAQSGAGQAFWMPSWMSNLWLTQSIGEGGTSFTAAPESSAAEVRPDLTFMRYGALHTRTAMELVEVSDITAGVDGADDVAVLADGIVGEFDENETIFSWLHLFRFEPDGFEISDETDTVSRVTVKLVEVPFGDTDAVQDEAWLFEFRQGPAAWRVTSRGEVITATGVADEEMEFIPADVKPGRQQRTPDFQDEGFTIRVGTRKDTHPLRQFLAGNPVVPMEVRVWRAQPGSAVADDSTLFFTGRVDRPRFEDGGKISVECSTFLRVGESGFPRFGLQSHCNWALFSVDCGLIKGLFQVAGTVSDAGSTWVEAAAFDAKPDTWFSLGYVEWNGQVRMVTRHAGRRLRLSAPFQGTPAEDDPIMAWPGCDGRWETCKAKFNNGENFGADPWIPIVNPQLKAKAVPEGGSGKKG